MVLHNLILTIYATSIQCRKYCVVPKQVDPFFQTQYWVRAPDIHCAQLLYSMQKGSALSFFGANTIRDTHLVCEKTTKSTVNIRQCLASPIISPLVLLDTELNLLVGNLSYQA